MRRRGLSRVGGRLPALILDSKAREGRGGQAGSGSRPGKRLSTRGAARSAPLLRAAPTSSSRLCACVTEPPPGLARGRPQFFGLLFCRAPAEPSEKGWSLSSGLLPGLLSSSSSSSSLDNWGGGGSVLLGPALRGIRCVNISELPENMTEAGVGCGKVALFRQEKRGGCTYRIPALLYLPPESTFLAFAEERSSPKDDHAKFLVLRRGRKEGTSVQWGPQEALTTATLPSHRTMNPCPVYEKKSATIFLFFICVKTHVSEWHQIRTGKNAARLCYVVSQDGGRTWSQTTDLTEQVIGEDLRDWATFAVGPGHGLQLNNGRLVIPAYTYYIHKRCFGYPVTSCTKPHSLTFYSDDGGQNWARSRLLKSLRTSECQVAELTHQDDRQVLYCSARSPEKYRAGALCMDNDDRFTNPSLFKELCEPPNGCQGSVVSFSPPQKLSELDQKEDTSGSTHLLGTHPSAASHKNSASWLIFSHPTNRHKRLDLGIYLNTSPLERGSWKAPWVLHKGPSAYSDLAVCEEEKSLLFGCLFECGVSYECEEIAFQLFTDSELLRNVSKVCLCATSPSEEQLP